MNTSGNLDALVERVLDQAKKEAVLVVDRAKKVAVRDIERAERVCRERKAGVEASLKEGGDWRRRIAEAEMRQEAQRALMNAREAAIDDVFAEALRQFRAREGAAVVSIELLAGLIREGVGAIGGSSVKIRLNSADRKLLEGAGVPAEMDGAKVSLDKDPVEVSGGPIVTDESGRIMFENTFEARLDRIRKGLRRQVADTLRLREEKGVR